MILNNFMKDIPFDNNWKKIAISLSGGADSALLTYLLCQKISHQEVHIISHIRCWKTKPWQEYDALNVYNWFTTKFPEIKFFRHTNFISPDLEYGDRGPILIDEYGKNVSGDNAEIRSFAEYICYTKNIDCYYNAVTRNPEGVELEGAMKERDVDPKEDNDHLYFMQHMGRYACHPFRFIDKSWVMQKYKDLKITDLRDITRSCDGIFENLDYRSYNPGYSVPTCGKCFWCKEREWALKQVS
jgi:hypothetical protein